MSLYWHVYCRHMCMTRPSTRVKFSEANDYYTHNIVNIYALGIFTLIKSQYYFFLCTMLWKYIFLNFYLKKHLSTLIHALAISGYFFVC